MDRTATENSLGWELEIRLQHVNPEVVRQIQVPKSLTFDQLHMAIQEAMGWQSYHLYEFQDNGISITAPNDETEFSEATWDATQHHLNEFPWQEGHIFTYIYDFGDYWVHTIRIDKRLYSPLSRPRVIGGAGACPPEDVGGPPGYRMFLEALEDPAHPEHDTYVNWSQGHYNREFSVEQADRRLSLRF